MAKELLNEAERYLLDNWLDARLFEQSMTNVRERYAELFQPIIDAVTKSHPELDFRPRVEVRRLDFTGQIGFSRLAWPKVNSKYPSGFWIENLRIEELLDEKFPAPRASVWMDKGTAEEANIDLKSARHTVYAAAREIMTKEEFERCSTSELEEDYFLTFPGPDRHDLLKLFAAGDRKGFAERFLPIFDSLARFIPTLDKIFGTSVKKPTSAK